MPPFIIGLMLAGAAVSLLIAGCDKSEKPAPPPPRPAVAAGKASVTGKVRFVGLAPEPRPLPAADCHLGGPPLVDESVVVDAAGGLRNVIVYIKDGPPVDVPGAGAGAGAAVLMDQVNCRFAPHVVAVRAGQALRFHSSDATLHNVRGVCEANPPFNLMMASAGQTNEMSFARPEFFQVRCDVHPWMTAYVGVFDHPLFAVTGEGGNFTLEHLPPGSYVLCAWHERHGTREQPVTVSDGPANVDFEFGK